MSKFFELKNNRGFITEDGLYKNRFGKILKGTVRHGYHFVYTGNKQERTHRLVAEAFLGEVRDGFEVNHKDGNKANNELSNLEWCTRAENTKHGHRTKLINNFGERNGRAKLTESDIFKIRVLANIGHKHRSLSEQFKVSKSNIDKIVKMKIWKNIATS